MCICYDKSGTAIKRWTVGLFYQRLQASGDYSKEVMLMSDYEILMVILTVLIVIASFRNK